ncbi:CHAP domain protein [Bifidobacterium gallicum DSM 20093 = LMG 11596]|nr:CHAP domain protein [Bifidobacterium gallicum DSM 20093 = LMG 11596]
MVAAVLPEVNVALAAKLNEVAPMTRRALRLQAKANQRRTVMLSSTALAALVGTAATALALTNANRANQLPLADDPTTTTQITRIGSDAASRSEFRESLSSTVPSASASDEGDNADWNLGSSNEVTELDNLSKSQANNPVVAQRMDQDRDVLPEGFNPNHETGNTPSRSYPYGQCTWWAYTRRAQLGLPTGSGFGDARMWSSSAKALGYWVDSTPRAQGDVVVFGPGQAGASGYYGHVAVVEEVHKDGSIKISESNVKGLGVISDRTFTAEEAAQFSYIHY